MLSTLNLDAFNAYLDAAQKKHPTKNLAERLGTTDRTLRRWKAGHATPSLLVVEELQVHGDKDGYNGNHYAIETGRICTT